jgi:hypothetical protein
MKKVSLTRKELELFARHALGMAEPDLRRMSTQLLAQLLQLKINGDSRALQMAAEIKCLENVRRDAGRADSGQGKAFDDWVVYKRYHDANYYLTLARLDEGDQRINRRVNHACAFDFPFLKEAPQAHPVTGSGSDNRSDI